MILPECEQEKERKGEVGSGKVSQFRFHYHESLFGIFCGFMTPLLSVSVPDASSLLLASLPPSLPVSPALALSGQLSVSAEAQLMKR